MKITHAVEALSRLRSRRAGAVLLATIMLAGLTTEATTATQSVRLRYGLKPGTAYRQAASMKLDMTVDPSSLPAGLAPLAQSMAGGMKQTIEFQGLLDVEMKAADGSIPFAFRVTEAHGSFTRGSETKEVPSIAAVTGKEPIRGRFTADGRRIELDPGTGGTGGADRRLEQLAQGLPELPENEIRVGDSFDALVPMRLPSAGAQAEAPVETRWVYTLRSVEAHRALFDVRQVIPELASATLSKGRRLGLAGGAAGTATFDLKEGCFTSILLDAAIDLTYAVPVPENISIPGSTGATAEPGAGGGAVAPTPPVLSLKSRLTGPIAIEMGKAAR